MSTKDNTPVIFIHFGDSFYLEYVFLLAVKYNPGKRIILLGDDANKKYTQLGIEHHSMDKYLDTEDVKLFLSVYKYTAGKDFVGGEYWTRFNFLKMFALKNFWKINNLKSIWLFDSDVLITEDLLPHEYKFAACDYSFHNDLLMPQGMFNNFSLLEKLTQFFTEKFQDRSYIEKTEIEFLKNTHYGLTYMRFFKEFYDINPSKLIDYKIPVNKEVFDPCLFEQFQNGCELYPIKTFQYRLKKVFFYPSGEVFVKKDGVEEYIKMITINLSWLPDFIVKRIYQHAAKFNGEKSTQYNYGRLKLMHLNSSSFVLWKRRFFSLLPKFKR